MLIKICGITSAEDGLAAVDAGADALGFNFYPRSPRYVTPERAAEIAGALTPGVLRVGVFVNESPAAVAETMRTAGLDVAQLHGDERPVDYAGLRTWKALRVEAGFHPEAWRDSGAEALLLDGPAGVLYGGAGTTFDWRLAGRLGGKVIVAGGLDEVNVARAIEMARPWGVDACSRLESAPGRKDHEKMRRFIQAARTVFA